MKDFFFGWLTKPHYLMTMLDYFKMLIECFLVMLIFCGITGIGDDKK